MKMIRAIIQPHRLDMVRDALKAKGIAGMTAYQAQGFGRQKGHKEIYRGAEYEIHFLPKITLDLVVKDEDVPWITETIINTARTGSIGDGKIFVWDVQKAVRIRTGETDDGAL